MRFYRYIIFLFIPILARAQALPPIGEWREHLPYNSAIDIAIVNNKIFCATPYSLFSVDPQGVIERHSRMTGLSETGISAIEADETGKSLLVAYTNSDLDLVSGKNIYNIPGIRQSAVAGNKTIYNIHSRGRYFYLSTGLGMIVIDAERREVKETWYLGSGASQIRVNDFTSDDQFYYAATEAGLRRLPLTGSDPTNPAAWQDLSGINGLSAGPVFRVKNLAGRIIAGKNDSLFVLQGANWSVFYVGAYPVINASVSSNKLIVCERSGAGNGRITILNADASVYRVLAGTGAVSLPRDAILVGADPWVADQYACLSHIYPSGHYDNYTPNSPQAVSSGEMTIENSVLYVSAGSVNDSWNYQYNGDGLFLFDGNRWANINRYRFPVLDSLLDYITIIPDPLDASYWAGSFGGGLLHVKEDEQFEIFKQNFLGETIGDPGSYRVGGLQFDQAGNLWVANFGAAQPLRVRRRDGGWKNFTIPFFLAEQAVSQIIIDDQDLKWIVSPLGNGLLVFDHGSSIEDPSDDRWRKLSTGVGNGNLPSGEVLSIAKDKKGMIWVGTANGIAVIECGADVFGGACDGVWPVVPNGSFAGYLFRGQEVRSIAVDGANRKWVATPNGVFLVSADGEEVIYRFTETNSLLLSNDVRKIAIDGKSGEVWFATLKGLCSFRSTATEGGEKNEKPLVIFPNPVPHGYSGTIGIRGVVNDGIVKITELDGRLVTQVRALGGQAIWDGRNYRGQRISSGVYLVLVDDEKGKENVAGKIFFVK